MRRRTNRSRLQPIGEILFATFKKRGMAAKLEENSIFKFWPKAVGEKIALQTRPDCLRNKTLFVKTTSSVWVQQLHFMKEEIREKLNEMAGKAVIKEIRFTIGHEISKKKPAPEEEIPVTKRTCLKERDRKMIAECTAALADKELATILKRVMQKEISRRRRMQRRPDR